jgi:iron complex transport system substrate-binding protein
MQSKPRIVSLCPSNTELVHALGLSDCLVGVDNYSDYPVDTLKALPRLGPDLNIDMDKVVALKPDLTIASLSVPGMEHVVAQLTATGLPHVVLSPHSIEDIYDDMHTLTEALSVVGTTSRCLHVVQSLRSRVERIQSATRHLTVRPKLYWEWWPSPVFSPAEHNWLTEVSQIAGADNLFADCEGDQVQDDGSLVLSRQPDYFLAVWTGVPQQKVPFKKILSRDGWDTLPAIRQHRLYILSEGLYCRPSPRLIDGLEQLVGLLYPEIASDLGLQSVERYAPVRDIHENWLGGITPL